MEDFDLDLVDELCTSFCTPYTSQSAMVQNTNVIAQSPVVSTRKRSSTLDTLDTSITKKVCLNDVTNRSIMNECDEMNSLDDSALQMLARYRSALRF